MKTVRRLALVTTLLAGLSSGALANITAGAASSPTRLLSCSNATVVRPSNFVLTCADGYTRLVATRWSIWSSSEAVGATTFVTNLCTPNCVSSQSSRYTHASVRLFAPSATRHGTLFSRLVVHYRARGVAKTFTFSWLGDPAF